MPKLADLHKERENFFQALDTIVQVQVQGLDPLQDRLSKANVQGLSKVGRVCWAVMMTLRFSQVVRPSSFFVTSPFSASRSRAFSSSRHALVASQPCRPDAVGA